MKEKTNFDHFLEEQLQDPAFAQRFGRAGQAWDVALQLAALREQAGLSQQELAKRLHLTPQQIRRLESPSSQGHSLSLLRRVAKALHARVRLVIEPELPTRVAEPPTPYGTKAAGGKRQRARGKR